MIILTGGTEIPDLIKNNWEKESDVIRGGELRQNWSREQESRITVFQFLKKHAFDLEGNELIYHLPSFFKSEITPSFQIFSQGFPYLIIIKYVP